MMLLWVFVALQLVPVVWYMRKITSCTAMPPQHAQERVQTCEIFAQQETVMDTQQEPAPELTRQVCYSVCTAARAQRVTERWTVRVQIGGDIVLQEGNPAESGTEEGLAQAIAEAVVDRVAGDAAEGRAVVVAVVVDGVVTDSKEGVAEDAVAEDAVAGDRERQHVCQSVRRTGARGHGCDQRARAEGQCRQYTSKQMQI